MNEKTQTWSRSSALQILALVAVLVVLTVWATQRTQALLNRTLEKTVARQAADLSIIAEERFNQEFEALSFAAGLLSSAPDKAEEARILSELRGSEDGVSVGIFSVEGKAISGEYLSRRNFLSLPNSFRGQRIVDYCIGKGLLFAVPIRHGPNIRAILYRLYSDAVLPNRFSLTAYHPYIHLLLSDKTGQILVPYKRFSEESKNFYTQPAVREAFANIREKLGTNRAASACVEIDGKTFFLFTSDLPQTNCAVSGYIPWSAVIGDIALVHERLLRSIGLLLLFSLVVGLYLFRIRQKAMESDALRREKELADSANQAKGAFLASISHEIRTPINAVLGMNEMILREGKDPVIDRYAQNVRAAGRTLLDLINDVLDFSKIESGKIEIVEDKYRLSELINNAVNMAKPRAEGKGLAFHLDVAGNLPDVLVGDSTRVQQVVVNLLTNAAKYTEKGRVEFLVAGERTPEGQTVSLRFIIRDTGIGIREEDRSRLFEGFERLDLVRNRSIEGTGLGLAITKRLVERMGGTIDLESVYGEGSTFTVTLPQAVAGEELIGDISARLAAPGKKPAYRVSFTAPEAKLLVADDNEMNLFVFTSLLKKTKMAIDAVTSGQAVLDHLKERRYDVVLLDHRMPGMDGVDTLHAAKALPNAEGVPFLILTADAIAGMKEKFIEEGFDDYLAKPLDSETLEQMIMRYLPKEKIHHEDAPPDTHVKDETVTPSVTAEEFSDEPPVLDKSLGLQYSGHSEDFYREMVVMFCKLYPQKKAQLAFAFQAGQWEDYATHVHGLKSSSLSIGGKKLSHAAKKIEATGRLFLSDDTPAEEKEQLLSEIRNSYPKLLALYDELIERLQELTYDHA